MMKYWLDTKPDDRGRNDRRRRLHQTDKSYRCLGIAAARVVAAGINRSTTAGVVVCRPPIIIAASIRRGLIFPGFKRLSGSSAC